MLYKDQPPSDPPPVAPVPPAAADAEQLAKQLRVAIRQSRPWSKGRKAVGLALLVVLTAALAWWLWPRPEPIHVYVFVPDQVTVAGQDTTLRIATEPANPNDQSWGGQQVFVQELDPLTRVGGKDSTIALRTDDKGLAAVVQRLTATGSYALIEVRYLDAKAQPLWYDKSHGQVFTWPLKSPLLVIELTAAGKNVDLPAMAAALQQAQGLGWKVVYLATEPERPSEYHKLRGWAQQEMAEDVPSEKLPLGPVLGRLTYFDGANAQQARTEVLAALKQQFQGQVVCAKVTQDALTVHVVGSPQATEVRIQPGTWKDLETALKQVAP
jgi:hypothetical protein